MSLALNEEQLLLKDSAEGFFRKKAPVRALRQLRDERDPDGFSRDLWREMVEMGWAGTFLPDEYGGLECGFVELGVEPLPHGKLRYYVQDTGRGIPPDRQEELFRPFKRRTDDPEAGHFFSGSGIGLSIARRLVEAMGSTLEFRTSDEEGTRFHFDLRSPARR